MVRSTPKALRNRLNKYAFALACTVAIVAAVILIVLDRTLTREEALSAVGLNLLSSIVFAVIFALLSTQTQERNLLETLAERFEHQDRQIMQHIHQMAARFLPSKTYQATSRFGAEFNQDVTQSLSRSRQYAFRGTSAKYLAARIKLMARAPHQLRITMLDPADEPTVRRRAVDRQRHGESQGKSLPELITEIKEEVYMSLISLFDLRHTCPVEVLLTKEPVITRMELFDDSVYLSWYQGPSSTSHPFPETYRFDAESFIYQTELLTQVKGFEDANRITRFDSTQPDEQLPELIARVSGADVTDVDVTRWRAAYRTFISDFEAMLERLNAPGRRST